MGDHRRTPCPAQRLLRSDFQRLGGHVLPRVGPPSRRGQLQIQRLGVDAVLRRGEHQRQRRLSHWQHERPRPQPRALQRVRRGRLGLAGQCVLALAIDHGSLRVDWLAHPSRADPRGRHPNRPDRVEQRTLSLFLSWRHDQRHGDRAALRRFHVHPVIDRGTLPRFARFASRSHQGRELRQRTLGRVVPRHDGRQHGRPVPGRATWTSRTAP